MIDKLQKIDQFSSELSDVYRDLSLFNLRNKECRLALNSDDCKQRTIEFLEKTPEIKAVTVCFSNIEGRLHMLDYDKLFLLKSADNLTFDGSSIRGFSSQHESDLRLEIDWSAFYLLPWDVFGQGKILVFAFVKDKDGSFYSADMRSVLKKYLDSLRDDNFMHASVAAEIEGFLVHGVDAEKSGNSLQPVTTGGYYDALPCDQLRQFIDKVADVQRATGFQNEKDHPEVAPSQFEMNWSHTEALIAADQIQLYKLISRQVARLMGLTATFLPKPIVGINGSGMHVNISIGNKLNYFYKRDGEHCLSVLATNFIKGILAHAEALCLILNSSVNAYRRLDPHYEAPNAIFASAINRGAMIRIPIGNEKSARIEVRAVAPDANPYMLIYALLKAGLTADNVVRPANNDPLPSNIYEAIDCFVESKFIHSIFGDDAKKYCIWKQAAADRCPRLLGDNIKPGEILFHHEVTNQQIWSQF